MVNVDKINVIIKKSQKHDRIVICGFHTPGNLKKSFSSKKYKMLEFYFLADINYTFCLIMTPIIPSLSPLFEFQLSRNISGTDFGTGYRGTVCGFHTRPPQPRWNTRVGIL